MPNLRARQGIFSTQATTHSVLLQHVSALNESLMYTQDCPHDITVRGGMGQVGRIHDARASCGVLRNGRFLGERQFLLRLQDVLQLRISPRIC